jgi:hypothetical protein
MRSPNPRRSAFVMVLVLGVTALVGVLLTVLSFYSAAYYRSHQADRTRLITRVVTDSVAACARSRASQWREHRPTEPVSIDIASLLPAGSEGSAVITFPAGNDRPSCHIAVHILRGRYEGADELDLDLPPPPTTQPASRHTP